MHEDEERTLATLTAHRRIIDDLIVAGRGEISGTAGDSVLAEFASVVHAVHCAVGIQQALTKANRALPPEGTMMLRIGINVGDVMVKDGSIFGDGVNVAARLEALAEPGGICVTRGVRDQVRDRLDYAFQDPDVAGRRAIGSARGQRDRTSVLEIRAGERRPCRVRSLSSTFSRRDDLGVGT